MPLLALLRAICRARRRLARFVGAVCLRLLTERVAFRPLRDADPATLLIASFAVSFFLREDVIMLGRLAAEGHRLPAGARRPGRDRRRPPAVLQIVTILVSASSSSASTWFLKATRFGLQMRAAAEDFRMARVLGVRANRVIAMAFAISGLLAAAVSCLVVAQTGLVQPRMGLQLVIIAFVGR